MTLQTIAAFDFDKTITRKDSFHLFARYVVGQKKWLSGLFLLLPSLLLFLFKKKSRKDLKEELLYTYFHGMPFEKLQKAAILFAKERLPTIVKKTALEEIAHHQKKGHQVVVISASLSLYLIPWAENHQIAHVLASELALDKMGCITGKLQNENCRGPEKVRRLLEAFGPKKDYVLYAYGDSAGDFELLALADHPFFRKV